jgi:hypothetical protein
MTLRTPAARLAISTVSCIALLYLFGPPLAERFRTGRNDFLQLYAGARLARTSGLYDIEASKRIHVEVTGSWYPSVYWSRLPWYALILSPLGNLPYQTAYRLWIAMNAIAVGAWLLWYARLWPPLPMLAALSVPLVLNFANGQDAGLVTACAGFSVLLIRRNRSFLAGLVLALCSIKFHLFLLLPVALIVHKQWRVLWGGLAGGAVLAMLSVLTNGWAWPWQFLKLVSSPELHPYSDRMPTIYGLLSLLGFNRLWLELLLSAGVVLWFTWLARKHSLEVALGLSFVGGLLISHHAYLADTLLLLLATALFALNQAPKPMLGLTIAAALPPVPIALLSGAPYSAVMDFMLLFILVLASLTPRHLKEAQPAP